MDQNILDSVAPGHRDGVSGDMLEQAGWTQWKPHHIWVCGSVRILWSVKTGFVFDGRITSGRSKRLEEESGLTELLNQERRGCETPKRG